jgi:hypothetical protein
VVPFQFPESGHPHWGSIVDPCRTCQIGQKTGKTGMIQFINRTKPENS